MLFNINTLIKKWSPLLGNNLLTGISEKLDLNDPI
jgi:hypothetical protein